MSLSRTVHGPWFVPGRDESRALNVWGQSALGESRVRSPQVVARCSHCDAGVFAIGAGGWALVSVTTAEAAGGSARVVQRVRQFSNINDVGDAMAEHEG
jgi:hypothetical protein